MSAETVKKLVLVVAVLAGLYGIAALFGIGRTGENDYSETPLAVALERIEEAAVDAIVFPGVDPEVRIERSRSGWTVNGFDGDSAFVADFWAEEALSAVEDLIATNRSNHQRLGVDEANAASIVFEFSDGSTETLLTGGLNIEQGSNYFRLPQSDEVYLVNGDLRLFAVRTLTGWQNRLISQGRANDVQGLELTRDGATTLLSRNQANWEAEGVMADSATVGGILENLDFLQSERVLPNDSLDVNLDAVRTFRAVGVGGSSILELRFWEAPNQRFFVQPQGDSIVYVFPGRLADALVPTPETLGLGN